MGILFLAGILSRQYVIDIFQKYEMYNFTYSAIFSYLFSVSLNFAYKFICIYVEWISILKYATKIPLASDFYPAQKVFV